MPEIKQKTWTIHDNPTPEMMQAFQILRCLTEAQRMAILCWFCDGCRRYVGPGDACYCQRDE